MSFQELFLLRCLPLVALLLASCTHTLRIQDYPFDGVELAPAEMQEFEKRLSVERSEFQSLRMLSRCILRHDDERYEFRYAFVARAPVDLRIEQFPLTGFYSLSALVSNAERTTVVFQNEQRALITQSGRGGLQKLLGVDLPLTESDVGPLLSGVLPERFDLEKGAARRGDPANSEILFRSETLLARFNREFRLQEFHLFDPDSYREQISLLFSYDQSLIPKTFTLRFPKQEVELECAALQRSRNDAIRGDVFELSVPAQYSIERD